MKNNKLKIKMYKKYGKITQKLNKMYFLNNFLIIYFVFFIKDRYPKAS